MRYGALAAGIAGLALSLPAIAQTPSFAPSAGTSDIVAQNYAAPPSSMPAPTPYPAAVTPPAPYQAPAPGVEARAPASRPTYGWEPGHWNWNGVQYQWQAGRYVAQPTPTVTYKPGHWEQRPEGWIWVSSQ